MKGPNGHRRRATGGEQLGRLILQPQGQRPVEAQQEHAPAGRVTAACGLEREQRLARAGRPVEHHARRAAHLVEGAELLLRVAADLLLGAPGADLGTVEELEVPAQRAEDPVRLLASRLAGSGIESREPELGGTVACLPEH